MASSVVEEKGVQELLVGTGRPRLQQQEQQQKNRNSNQQI